MQKFIYVFDEDARDKLADMGYELLKSDASQKIYVFANKNFSDFSCNNIGYVLSDRLTF